MSRKFKLLTIVGVLVGILVIVFAGTALARGPVGTDIDADSYCGLGWGGWHGEGTICSETVSDLLGLGHEEIHELRQAGQSMTEIAAAQGVSGEDLVTAILAARAEALLERVADGVLTQERADLMLQQMEQRTIEALNRTDFGPFEGTGFCGGGRAGEGSGDGGMMRSRGSQGGYGPSGFGMGPGMMRSW